MTAVPTRAADTRTPGRGLWPNLAIAAVRVARPASVIVRELPLALRPLFGHCTGGTERGSGDGARAGTVREARDPHVVGSRGSRRTTRKREAAPSSAPPRG